MRTSDLPPAARAPGASGLTERRAGVARTAVVAALVLLSAAGIAINAGLGGIAGWLLRRRGEA